MSNRVTMGQDDSMMLQRDTLPMQDIEQTDGLDYGGKLKMGEKLNTEELARQLGVSSVCQSERLEESGKNGTG